MSGMLKISEAASIAIHAIVLMASSPGNLYTIRKIASALSVSENHLSKIMQRLSKEGLVSSVRGPSGGFKIAGDINQITLLNVYEAIEGHLTDTFCLLDPSKCRGEACIMGDLIKNTNNLVRNYLAGTRIIDLVDVFNCRI